MTSKLFDVMKLLERRGVWFDLRRSASTSAVIVNATLVGARLAIVFDERDEVCAYIYRGDESVEVGMDAVRNALDQGEPASAAALGYVAAPFPAYWSHPADDLFRKLLQDAPRVSKLFNVVEELEKRGLAFTLDRSSVDGLLITVQTIGRWIEIQVDLDDMVDVCVLSATDKVQPGMDAIRRAIDEND